MFVGTPDGLESEIVPAAGVRFIGVPARGFDRARPWTLVSSSFGILASMSRSLGLLHREKPDVVIGFGGYVCVPVGLAAVVAGVPLLLHEQNSVPGLANRLLARYARAIAVTYPGSEAHFVRAERVVVTGNPVREDFLRVDRTAARFALGIPDDAFLLLVFGGSRGARHINDAVAALAPRLLAHEGLRVMHLTGRTELDRARDAVLKALGDAKASPGAGDPHPRWRLLSYLDDMASVLGAADLVVARAGATTIAELTAVGAPALLVPYPYATDDHQTGNASALVELGAAVMVADADLDGPGFADELLSLIEDGGRRATMSAASKAASIADAAARVADLARAVARGTQLAT